MTTIDHLKLSKQLKRPLCCGLKGGPEPLENEINEILGSKREDRLSDPFFRSGTKYLFGSFFEPASPQQFL